MPCRFKSDTSLCLKHPPPLLHPLSFTPSPSPPLLHLSQWNRQVNCYGKSYSYLLHTIINSFSVESIRSLTNVIFSGILKSIYILYCMINGRVIANTFPLSQGNAFQNALTLVSPCSCF